MARTRLYLRLLAAALPLAFLSSTLSQAQEPPVPPSPPPSVPLPDEPRPPGDHPRRPPHDQGDDNERSERDKRDGKGRKFRVPSDGEVFRENTRKMLQNMTPAQRQEFWRNFQRWMRMKPEQKEELMQRDKDRRKKMRDEVEQTLKEIGIPEGDEETKKKFFRRYAQERRAIEEKLRKEMEEKRRPQLQELKERLKAEFSKPAALEEKKPESSAPPEAAPETPYPFEHEF